MTTQRGRRPSGLWILMTAGAVLVGLYGAALVATNFAFLPEEIAANRFGTVLRVHILTSSLALLLGPWQFSASVRRRSPRLHRWTGRAYGVTVLLGGVTGILAAASTANGPVAGAGFAVLGVLWVGVTVLAVRYARARELEAHRRWAIVSFALAYAAVMLRLYIPLSMAAGFTFAEAYPVIAWLCWVPNLWVAYRLGRTQRVALAA